MFADNRTQSPQSLYRSHPDPYLGSAPPNGGRSSNGSANQSSQEEFDIQAHPPSSYPPVSSNLASTISSYLEASEALTVAPQDGVFTSGGLTRNRPNSGPPVKFMDEKVPADYRPPSVNSYNSTKPNSALENRGSPAQTLQVSSASVPSPVSPGFSGSDRSHNIFSGSAFNHKPSAFKPLPHAHQTQMPQAFPFHEMPGHAFPHGLGSHKAPGYLSPNPMDPNLSQQPYASEYEYNNMLKRKQNQSCDNDTQRPNSASTNAPDQSNQVASTETEQNRRVVVPAGKLLRRCAKSCILITGSKVTNSVG